MNEHAVRSVETDVLRIAYVEHGPTDGWPVILSHGFPYDVHAYDEVASILARSGHAGSAQPASFPMMSCGPSSLPPELSCLRRNHACHRTVLRSSTPASLPAPP